VPCITDGSDRSHSAVASLVEGRIGITSKRLGGCGFRRSELAGLELGEIQIRQGHWAVVDLTAGVREGWDIPCRRQDGEGLGEGYLGKM